MKISPKHLQLIKEYVPEAKQQAFLDAALNQALVPYLRALKAPSDKGISGEIFVDGGSRGNPGPAGGGFVIFNDGIKAAEGSIYFGVQTNNQAEYLALREALRKAYEVLGNASIQVYMDSQLVVEQLCGNYKVKSENVRPLYEEVSRIISQFQHFKIIHVSREQNSEADRLANLAMDRKR